MQCDILDTVSIYFIIQLTNVAIKTQIVWRLRKFYVSPHSLHTFAIMTNESMTYDVIMYDIMTYDVIYMPLSHEI